MAEWAGIVNTTARKYLKGESDETMRGRLLLALLQKYGRVKYGENGYNCTWTVKYAQQDVRTAGDATPLVFGRSDLRKQLTLDWGGYYATDEMTEKESLINTGDVAIIKRYDTIMPDLKQAMTDEFGAELLVDGYASGNDERIHGIESFFGEGTCGAADRLAQPSDTYAGQSTALQGSGGTWSASGSVFPNATVATDYPDGSGDPEYDWLSPKLINVSSTGWGTGSTTFEDNCERAIRQSITWLTRTSGKTGKPTLTLLGSDYFNQYQNHQESRVRINIPHPEALELGFPGAMNQEGVMVDTDFDVAASTGYAINVHKMELACMYKQLFMPKGPDRDPRTDSWLFKIGFFGNLRFQPKHFGKFRPYA